MNWIKQNWFKIGSLVCFALVAFGVVFYFAYYLPKRNNESRKIQTEANDKANTQKCLEVGQQSYKAFQQRYSSNDTLIFEPRYHYNKNLNTCLAYFGYNNSSGLKMILHEIVDVYANNPIATYSEIGGDYNASGYADFRKKSDDLLSQ